MKYRATIILAVIFLGIAIWQGSTSLHRYATPAQALATGGRVQVMGILEVYPDGVYILGEDGARLPFDMEASANIRLEPGKPTVAIGVVKMGKLVVNRILYKCPSKYER